MSASLDESMLFGVVALENKAITDFEFLRAANDARESEACLRTMLIQSVDFSENEVAIIDALVTKRLASDFLTDKATIEIDKRPVGSLRTSRQLKVEDRYRILSELGRGGLGVVKRVADENTSRSIAYKTLRVAGKATGTLTLDDVEAETVERFREESKVCAQLEHPNIVPVYEIGEDVRGIPYYTMRAIEGQTLNEAINRYHAQRFRLLTAAKEASDEEREELSLMRSRLYHTFADVCKALAYAHSKGVIHRDLKSANVMVGAYGETILLDWGIAKVKGRPDHAKKGTGRVTPVRENAMLTMEGEILGTPCYMSPEQAGGIAESIDELSDVYALGALLYEILTGAPPFYCDDVYKTLDLVLFAKPPEAAAFLAMRDAHAKAELPLENFLPSDADYDAQKHGALDRLSVPAELSRIAMHCMQKNRKNRVASAKELYESVLNFLEGSQHHLQQQKLCLEALAEGQAASKAYYSERDKILGLEVQEAALRQRTPSHATLKEKRPLWSLEDQLRQSRDRVKEFYNSAVAKLTEANGYDPDNGDAAYAISAFFWDHLIESEARGDADEALFCEARVRQYDKGSFAEGLAGGGTLSLTLDDADTEIWCFRYDDDGRRSRPIALDLWDMRDVSMILTKEDGTLDLSNEVHAAFAKIGVGKVSNLALEMGSYLLVFVRDGKEKMRLPFELRRSEHLSLAISLPTPDACLPLFVTIPASRFIYGGDPKSNNVFRQVQENSAFAIAKHPVSASEYRVFLHSLPPEDADRHVPRVGHTPRRPLWQRNAHGLFEFPEEMPADGPVVGVSWEDAMAYAAWLSEEEERLYTLPSEAQWEHAARGADGRFFPWGFGVDATFLNCSGARAEDTGLVDINSYPIDESPFGVRGMGGNVRDWCLDNPGSRRKDLRIVRGGFWSNPAGYARSASRPALHQEDTSWEVGFRLVAVFEEG